MTETFLIYGSTGTVGRAVARLAVAHGLRPILAGRSADRLMAQAAELDLEGRVINLADPAALAAALRDVRAVLHCAGPFIHTYLPMAQACLASGAHYLDISGEIPVYQGLVALDGAAQERGVMLLPSVGFDVVPTDCLAAALRQRLPSADRLTLAFRSQRLTPAGESQSGGAGMPPGTMNTMIEHAWMDSNLHRLDGQIQPAPRPRATRLFDFGSGPTPATLFAWGDIFTAYYSTGIPNIQVYLGISPRDRRLLGLIDQVRPLLRPRWVRRLLQRLIRPIAGSTASQRAQTRTSVWGEVQAGQGQSCAARVHGPEAGVDWTAQTALAAVQRVLGGEALPGFQTPAKAFGAEFGLSGPGVSIEWLA